MRLKVEKPRRERRPLEEERIGKGKSRNASSFNWTIRRGIWHGMNLDRGTSWSLCVNLDVKRFSSE